MEGEENMKVHYDKDEDILMLVLSSKKIDDSYETENGNIVSVTEDGEPVMIDIFKASEFLKDLGKAIPKSIRKRLWFTPSTVAVTHRIK